MADFFTIFQNKIVVTCFFSYLAAQLLKIIIVLIDEKRLDFRLLFASGGMPSSHSSTVMTLFLLTGLYSGWTSTETAIAVILAVIVMYDASGVRRAAGEQAKVLNEIMELVEHKRMVTGEKLRELLGHTPLQVFAGAVLGIAVALISYYFI